MVCNEPSSVGRGSMAALFDQSVLESLPHEQRQKLVKKARQHQINLYLEREKELAKAGDAGSERRERKPNERIVHFNVSDKLRDAINNFYDKEGETHCCIWPPPRLPATPTT